MTNDALINMSKVQKHLNEMADNARDNGYPHEVEVIQSVQDNLLDFVDESRAALAPVDVEKRNCLDCKGSGAFVNTAGDDEDCHSCRGQGRIAPVDADLMASIYEEERAKYVGGKVYYPNNRAAFMGCMNKALAARGFGVPDGWQLVPTKHTQKMQDAIKAHIEHVSHAGVSILTVGWYESLLKAALSTDLYRIKA